MEEGGGKRTVVVIIVVIAILVIVGGVCMCGGGFMWLVASAPEHEEQQEAAQRDGTAMGQRSSSEECIQAGYLRASRCGEWETSCGDAAEEYLRACLHAVQEPDHSICTGAPSTSGLLTDLDFLNSFCSQRGWNPDHYACDDTAHAVQTYCVAAQR